MEVPGHVGRDFVAGQVPPGLESDAQLLEPRVALLTIVSTMTFSKLCSVIVPVAFPAWIVACSSFSTPFSPIRFRQRVICEGLIGK